jgi:hypothetical protein
MVAHVGVPIIDGPNCGLGRLGQMSNEYDPEQLVTYNGGSKHMTLRDAVARYRHERSLLSPADVVRVHTDEHGASSVITEDELQKLLEHPDFAHNGG